MTPIKITSITRILSLTFLFSLCLSVFHKQQQATNNFKKNDCYGNVQSES